MPLAPATIALVKASIPALEQRGLDITRRMYERMFRNPAIRDLFNQSHHGEAGSQPKALAAAVLAYARNIDNLGALGGLVERIAQKHAGLVILPEHYPFVAEALLGAIGDVLGAAATPELLAAWGEAYWALADILISREAQIYRGLAETRGGWTGWRRFRIAGRQRESEVIASFYLVPEDGGPVLSHRPGQYLTFRLHIPGHGPLKRNYSISSAPSDRGYRISVKREGQGIVSNWLHDAASPGTVLEVAAPAGDFVLAEAPQRPVVLVSGGVGLTPLLSMLETIAERHPALETHWVHGALDGAVQAFGPRVQALAARHGRLRATTFHAAPRPEDRGLAEPGLITLDWLRRNTPVAEADLYLCGPRPFLRDLVGGLLAAGLPAERLHHEVFGPADALLAA
ncbi:NO-inducible flavohemoprotein [Roseicella frigidaeris]|uniref:Flavohemoprotein n=1 Tax=Roseicella frigidaeris TaxID=2230885 RepID=A0A327M0F0_9PROT|nr:NO-inducible flavohemoprotein [Roseicella frigidaeris]RAI56016.1 NO-inducible flavohemoprotein [Roseicella frigidaeris]